MKKDDGVFTLEKFREAVAYLNSPEYNKRVKEQMRWRCEGELLAQKAFDAGRITEAEYWKCMESIAINGFLVVPQSFAEKLQGLEPPTRPAGGKESGDA